MKLKLSAIGWVALAFAVLVALGFFVHEWMYPSVLHDASQYARMGREVADRPLFHRFGASPLRTYGYPFFLGFVHRGSRALGLPFQVLLFVIQLAAYVGACFLLRRAIVRLSSLAARLVFAGMLFNYYALIYTPQSLTESVSLTLLAVAGVCWLEAYRRNGGAWPLVAGSLIVGSALMVRPANMYIAVGWIAGIVLIGVRLRPRAGRGLLAAACIVGGLAIPTVPQAGYNVLRQGRWTPLLAQDLGKMQQVWGICDIKYATAMAPVPEAKIHYVNPFWRGTTIDEQSPKSWYLMHPWSGALTLALHTFNLTDQDLLFTYSRDLDPWYRLPLGVINHAAVALGLLGLLLFVRTAFREGTPEQRDGCLVLLVTMVANWAMYAWTAVEMRFGSVLLLTLFPLAGYAVMRLVRRRHVPTIAAASACVTAYVVLALLLSGWVRDQAPVIRSQEAASAALLPE